jgi:hypothetical protein
MLPAKRRNRHPTLADVQALFEKWRENKKGRDPIPPALWAEAVSLSRTHSINAISRHLHLSYNEVKARAQGHPTPPARVDSPAFVELEPVRLTIECTIEMEKPSGERMRIKGSCNVVELAREFWRR